MRKFFILLRKEIKELLTLQLILPLILTMFFFAGIGKVLSQEQEKASGSQPVTVLNQDKTITAGQVINSLNKGGLSIVERKEGSVDEALDFAKSQSHVGMIIIPAGFEASLGTAEPKKLEVYNFFSTFSFVGAKGFTSIQAALATVNESLSTLLLANKINGDPKYLKDPIVQANHVVIGSRQAEVDPNQVIGFVTQQTAFIPIVLFFVITFAAQMIGTAVATEKENKTLETLLSLPIDRRAIVAAKMVAAGFVALLMSAVYMIGFRSYINGVSGAAPSDGGLGKAAEQLGLQLGTGDYALLGLAMFSGILVILAIALILGAFAEDVKSLQGLISPLMILVLIPYLLTLFIDPATASPGIRYTLYAIPFSHAFLAASNIFLHNYAAVWLGIAYQLVIFIVFVLIAAKIFSTDHILTLKIRLKKKGS